jgi:uracil-DNA glycosylase
MLVGQAPGKTEVIDRRPFAVRAGKTLFRWLAGVDIDESVARRRIYIAAITRCYPGPSPSGRGDRLPSPREMSNCASWLDEDIALINPPVVILVGRLAIGRFLGDGPLDSYVGRVHAITSGDTPSFAIPLPHPSGASSWIHGPGHLDLVRASLRLIAAHVPELVRESALARSVA